MCNLCGTPEEQMVGRKEEQRKADDLQRMASYCRQLANGSLKPHSDEMKKVSALGRSILRDLFNDYV